MGILNPTPEAELCDEQGRPYFLWDEDATLDAFVARLAVGTDEGRGLDIGKLMRQAKPDDVFQFVTPREIARLWPHVVRNLGTTRARWERLFDLWEGMALVARR